MEGRIISISVSKVINKTSITIVSYGDADIPISNKFILISKTEENGIYTKTYIHENMADLELIIEREIENIADDWYIKTLYRKFVRKGGGISYTRTRIIGSPLVPAASHKPLISRKISLQDIIGYISKFPITEESEYLIEYGRDMDGGGGMCSGRYTKVESKRVVVRDYSQFPKLNFAKCKPATKSVTATIPEGSITVEYTTNAVCNVHRINSITIRKTGGMRPIR